MAALNLVGRVYSKVNSSVVRLDLNEPRVLAVLGLTGSLFQTVAAATEKA